MSGYDPAALNDQDRAAVRAYLQRSEVRLSTMHRVAAAMLSGAGLMVILPVVERDSVVNVVGVLVRGDLDAIHLLLAAAVCLALALPFTALWLVLRDLTQFYFHANHIKHAGGEAFTPRFTLTGLRIPSDDLAPPARLALLHARSEPRTIELLVPANASARARIDRQIGAYGLGVQADGTDAGRVAALFDLAASKERDLMEEVAKVEHGMARHVLRTQIIVLRYVKALLALLSTALAVFALAAVVSDKVTVNSTDEVWLAAILMLWAPGVIAVVTAPVRWLESQLRSEGATHAAVTDDREFTRMETVTIRLAVATFGIATVSMVATLASDDISRAARWGGIVVAIFATLALVFALRSWAGRRVWQRFMHG